MFQYALATTDGEIFEQYESTVSNWKAGDELRAAGNVSYRVTAVVPAELMEEFVGQPLCGLLEVELL